MVTGQMVAEIMTRGYIGGMRQKGRTMKSAPGKRRNGNEVKGEDRFKGTFKTEAEII